MVGGANRRGASGGTSTPIRMCSSEWHSPLAASWIKTSPARGGSNENSSTDHGCPIRGGWPRGSSLRSARGGRSSRVVEDEAAELAQQVAGSGAAGPQPGRQSSIFCHGWQSLVLNDVSVASI